ncbi:hypothetical protein AJ79_02302 [Helicocarpus griseus UAMH5409]|uniref:Uncharacterized protein n=1 Tax=Helicocarpus griseus UAMH5409 TaxID=1447875 RepID=A0A2B7Y4E1_9EURO|nr:hypothetical protein AJ79_02302 [Helicocarpus griseus UAMH5409]
MGRQPYMNLLALGRSPYEAPETPPEGYVAAERRAEDTVNADGYVQEYDARGHPINPSSKALARQLRRAKNDILSTMGIVVSGEDGNLGISKERQRMNLLSAENDYGLAMATLDQVVTFFSSWWTTSLSARIQTFKRYTHTPFMQIIHTERNTVGLFGFYCAGVPAWTASFVVSVCRNHFLEPAVEYLHGKISALLDDDFYKTIIRHAFIGLHLSCRLALFMVLGQTYMFSLLQSLHVLPALAVPSLRSLIPFGQTSLIQFPHPPTTLSAYAVGNFGFRMLTAPFTAVYMHVYLRPLIESRIYRILRRKLPKPDRPDNLSLRVAAENDLIEWTVPSLGRRSEEEYHRSDLTIGEEIKYELKTFKDWLMGIFTLRTERPSDESARRPSTSRSLRNRLEQLNREFEANVAPLREQYHPPDDTLVSSMQARGEQQLTGHVEGARPSNPTPDASAQDQFSANQILSNDEQRMSHSPLQLAEDYFEDDRGSQGTGRPGMEETFRMGPSASPHQPQRRAPEESQHQPLSRSNTLFSHSSTPESSPLTSPRVRASLVHQNSDVITMQLELLRSNHNSPSQARTTQDNNAITAGPLPNGVIQQPELSASEIDRTATEILDAILSNRGPGQTPGQTPAIPQTDLEALAELTSISNRSNLETLEGEPPTPPPLAATTTANELPDLPSSPLTHRAEPATTTIVTDDNRSLPNPPTLPTPATTVPVPRRTRSERLLAPDHRVTILSSLPVDSLSSHLASLLTSILFYPLESLYLRNFALQFLNSPYLLGGGVAATAIGLRADVRPVNAWCGGGTGKDMLAYLGKVGLVIGMEALVSTAIWGVGSAATILIGVRRFGWGEL